MKIVPENTKVLVLNQDYTPLNKVPWRKAMKRLYPSPCEKCDGNGSYWHEKREYRHCDHCNGTGYLPPAIPVEYYKEGFYARDGHGNQHLVPAVIANAHHVQRMHVNVPYSKANVLRRDGFRCQYCGKCFPADELTVDHVVPRSVWNGNSTSTKWKNIVTACRPCNNKKANKTPEQAGMQLRKLVGGKFVNYKKPKQPSSQEIALGLTYQSIPEEWEIYVAPFRKSV